MLKTWSFLPDTPLKERGLDSQLLIDAGCNSYRTAAKFLYELPYGRNSDRADYKLVLAERRGTCSTKHALLAALAVEQGLPVSLTVGIYEMCEANTPGVGQVLAAHELDSIPEAHCYLSHRGERIDITRAGAEPQLAIARFEPEWTIEPSQIGAHKEQLHRAHMEVWLRQHCELRLTAQELWSIREACITALAQKPSENQ